MITNNLSTPFLKFIHNYSCKFNLFSQYINRDNQIILYVDSEGLWSDIYLIALAGLLKKDYGDYTLLPTNFENEIYQPSWLF